METIFKAQLYSKVIEANQKYRVVSTEFAYHNLSCKSRNRKE